MTLRTCHINLLAVFALLLTSACSLGNASQVRNYFEVSPYLQLGHDFGAKSMAVVWITKNKDESQLKLEYKAEDEKTWKQTREFLSSKIPGHEKLILLQAQMKNLPQSKRIEYRLKKSEQLIFSSSFLSAAARDKAFDFAVYGDIGQGGQGEEKIAALLREKQPQLSIITGDIVYPFGSMGYYLRNFFPYLNEPLGKSAPFMSSCLLTACAGNHDLTTGGGIDARDLDMAEDSLAYFLLFKQPLNGPLSENGSNSCVARGNEQKLKAFENAAGAAYPRMTNFSYDWGNAHFLILDANAYMDWTSSDIRNWVEHDLKATKQKWKFVAFHQPGFNSDRNHWEEQRMRHLSDLFERGGVDLVFSGHSHSYQRSYPLYFKEKPAPPGDIQAAAGIVQGSYKLDKSFDGKENKEPKGVIYIVSGGGGARLARRELQDSPELWQPFTKIFFCKKHSVTLCHVDGDNLQLEQVADDGTIVDSFSICKKTKNVPGLQR